MIRHLPFLCNHRPRFDKAWRVFLFCFMLMQSEWPSHKIVVSCEKCGLRRQYDRIDMLRAGGDLTLAHLLDYIVERAGCTKSKNLSTYDRCGATYEELVRLQGRK